MLPTDHPDVLALQEELKRVLRFWMDMGADGFRADMAGALVKTEHVAGNDQFFTTRGEGTKVFWNKIRALMDQEYPGSFMVAEIHQPAPGQPRYLTAEHRTDDRRPRDHLRLLAHDAGDPVLFRDEIGVGSSTAFRSWRCLQASGGRPYPCSGREADLGFSRP
jgi:hypothetical protein